jgi:PEP-CTERM motif
MEVIMQGFIPRFSLAAMALAGCALVMPAQAGVIISTTPAPPVDSPGLTGFATTGAMMTGLSVTVAFNGGADHTFAWATTGANSGGVTTGLWSLTMDGDSFTSPWVFSFLSPNAGQLTHLQLNGTSGFVIFDRTAPSPGTDGSASGLDFAFSAGCGSCNGLVNYSGQTGIGGAAPVGDLWQVVDLTFSGETGPRTDFSFVQDTDNDIRAMVPEPETYALMLGGLGLLSLLAKRRRRS